MLDFSDIQDYLLCGLLYYLKRKTPLLNLEGKEQALPSNTTLDLPGLAITQSLSAYVTGKYPQLYIDLIRLVWEAWFSQKGVDDVVKSLKGYVEVQANILNQFLIGRITGRGRNPYIEPRRTARYKSMLDTSNLSGLAAAVDGSAIEKMGCVWPGSALTGWPTATQIRSR